MKIFWKYYENILKIFWKYLKYSKFRLEARFWVVSKGKNDSHDPLRPVALKYIKYFHHIFKYFHSIFKCFHNIFKIFQSYAKYSRKWQFCLILLPFPRDSDQLYCCFIQVFGIKLSLSLRGIEILKNLKYLVSICGRWSKISPTNLFSIKANNYLLLKPSLWASNTSDFKNSSS